MRSPKYLIPEEARLYTLKKTDDTLPFRTTLLEEYALLLAPPPLGLGLTESTVRGIAESGFQCCFKRTLDHRIQREDDDEDNDIMTPHLSSRL